MFDFQQHPLNYEFKVEAQDNFHEQNGVCGLVQIGRVGFILPNLDNYSVDIYI